MRFLRTTTLFFITIVSYNTVQAQKLESAQFINSFSSQEISTLAGIPVAYGVDLYKVRYYTSDARGEEHIASGLACIPQDDTVRFPLACYQHGTVDGREDVPSRLAGGYQLPLILSAFGYVTCAADFVGLGDSPGIHPYVHATTQATAGIDLLFAVREMSEDDNYPPFYVTDQLFIGGYSQGGHASMAAHKYLETMYPGEFDIAAAAHMSGPYSISEVMIDFTLGDQPYNTVSYLVWVALGYMEAYPEFLDTFTLEKVFKPEYLDDIKAFRDEAIGRGELNSRITNRLMTDYGAVLCREILLEDVLNSILSDPEYPLNQALMDNDVYDWAPQSLTNLYYCEGDEQVSFENAILAANVMTQNGAPNVQALRMDNTFPLNHVQCVSPVATSVVFFWGSMQQLLTSANDIELDDEVGIYYANDLLILDIPVSYSSSDLELKAYSLDGRLISSRPVAAGMSEHLMNLDSESMIVMSLFADGRLIKTQKFFTR